MVTEVEDNDSALPLFVLQGDIPQPPILVNRFLQGSPVEFELDTGAAVTVMSETKFIQLFPNHSLQHSSIDLKTYTGEAMEIVGETTIRVSYADQEPKMLSLVVVAGCGPSLLGRNWLQQFVLDWRSVKAVLIDSDPLRRLLQDYSDVFRERLGTITPFKAQLIVTPNAVPIFHRPRQVPYALKSQVEQELNRLEREGVLKRINHSPWGAPIVTVPKKDGTVCICGDYKVTVNPVLNVDQYPLPRPEDLFATLAGGKFFSTLDLFHACYYDVVRPLRLAADASAYGIGAVIFHVMDDGSERPIAFASRTLMPSEQNYAQVEKEALSLVFGVCKFHSYLYGRKFTLITDHKPLTSILGPKKGVPPIAAARLQRWALKLSAYSYEIEFRSTDKHVNADGLSRLPLNCVSPIAYTSEPSVFNLQQIESLPVTASKLPPLAPTKYSVVCSAMSQEAGRMTQEHLWLHMRRRRQSLRWKEVVCCGVSG